MRALCFGSLNIDNIYAVPHMVQPGETLSCDVLRSTCGGKGLNQSIALARAGIPVFHAGKVGSDGAMLIDCLRNSGVDISLISIEPTLPSGHAIIQVDRDGENCILLYPGANAAITQNDIEIVLAQFGEGDLLFLQNEVSCLNLIIEQAYQKGMTIVLNPSPMNRALAESPALGKIDWFILNEIEGEQITGETNPDHICEQLLARFPCCRVVLTLGRDGALYAGADGCYRQDAFPVQAVDTTAAGDTFTGYFFSGILRGLPPTDCLRLAAMASAITVGRPGASVSIPTLDEVTARL